MPELSCIFPYIRSGDLSGFEQMLGSQPHLVNERYRTYIGPTANYTLPTSIRNDEDPADGRRTESPLLCAIVRGGTHTLTMVRMLLANGVNVNYAAADTESLTEAEIGCALQRAATFSTVDILRYLIQKGNRSSQFMRIQSIDIPYQYTGGCKVDQVARPIPQSAYESSLLTTGNTAIIIDRYHTKLSFLPSNHK
jgi:hypothetical protein